MAPEKVSKAYEKINERIFELLEKGVVPWHQPWKGGRSAAPANFGSKRNYRGINVFLLRAMGFSSRYWLTYNQATEKGGQVRKGEKGCPVVFWKWLEKEETNQQTGEKVTGRIPLLRYYTVFNLEQIEGIDNPDTIPETDLLDFDPIEAADGVVQAMPQRPVIIHNEPRAYYRPATDQINMPRPELFESEEFYYQTLFHEMTHATGHESRLFRRPSAVIRHFGDKEYSQEELVAEMGAAYLCGHCGIIQQNEESSAAYIANWLQVLKNNKKMLINAAAQAQKAADFIIGSEEHQPASEEAEA